MSLEGAKAAFLEGYRIALLDDTEVGGGNGDRGSRLPRALAALEPEAVPFAYEGAAMGCRLREARGPDRRLVESLLRATDDGWHPFIGLGVGCALARLGTAIPALPMERDGYGFQIGLEQGPLNAVESQGDDHVTRGRGRSLWFVTGGDAYACARAIAACPADARALWRGVGTACTFAGDPKGHAPFLAELSGEHSVDVREGAATGLALWAALGDLPLRTRIAAAHLDVGNAGR